MIDYRYDLPLMVTSTILEGRKYVRVCIYMWICVCIYVCMCVCVCVIVLARGCVSFSPGLWSAFHSEK